VACCAGTVNGLTKFLMVLLRIAIGWHLCYEGATKIRSQWEGKNPFSAEAYLRNSTGPFADYFRGLVPDIHGLEKLDVERVEQGWRQTLDRIASAHAFTDEQRAKAKEAFNEISDKLREYLLGNAVRQKAATYEKDLAASMQANTAAMPSAEKDAFQKKLREINAMRLELIGPVQQWTAEFQAKLESILTDQQKTLPPPKTTWNDMTDLEKVNLTTMYGLFGFGACMIVGLFSRLSSLGAAVLLGLFYFSMPPWPGLPPNPMAEGTYFIVNKNLIEMIACLMLATSPSGAWGGLDALIRGLITRPLFGVGAKEVRDRFEQ
jgi:uncharacterized membrane protein YphA (DoxX/SURF4 family)